jgi:creatinine amidohydrolase
MSDQAGPARLHCRPMQRPIPCPPRARVRSPGPWLLCCLLLVAPAARAASVYLEELTSAEVAAALHAGTTTLLVPVGGTEQNGPHMVLGKHNVRARLLSGRIAEAVGHALVAPVVAYVPEGRIQPPTEHMRLAGTISVPEPAFRSVLEATAQSMRQHGFRDIVLMGDSGNYQAVLKSVADGLNRGWRGTGVRAHYLGAYYEATQTTYVQRLRAQGLSTQQIGTHAATADTSLLMALDPSGVRAGLLAQAAEQGRAGGTQGDPRPSSAALGQLGVQAVVESSVAALRQALAQPR